MKTTDLNIKKLQDGQTPELENLDKFAECFSEFMDEKNFTTQMLVEKCSVSKTMVNDLRNLRLENRKQPNRYKLIEMLLHMGADREEIDRFLELSGNKRLTGRSEPDLYILYAMKEFGEPEEMMEYVNRQTGRKVFDL